MQRLPHHYSVTATVAGDADHDIELTAPRLPILRTTSPAEFGGPGDRWSPETLLVGAVGDCLVLTSRGLAHRLNLRWTSVHCEVTARSTVSMADWRSSRSASTFGSGFRREGMQILRVT